MAFGNRSKSKSGVSQSPINPKTTWRNENYKSDPGPPMCGGAVFNKILSKSHATNTSSDSAPPRYAFDQRPVKSKNSSLTSSSVGSASQDSAKKGQHEQAQRSCLLPSTTKQSHNYDFPATIQGSASRTIESLSPELQYSIQSRSLQMGHFSQEINTSPNFLQFDPNEDNKQRSKQIRSAVGRKKKNASSPKASEFNSSLQVLTEVPSDAGLVMESLERSATRATAGSPDSIDNATKLEALRSMRDVVMQQQDSLKTMSSQNQYYRRKLGTAQTSFHQLQSSHINQMGLIEKLQMEKYSFETETLLLREEMQQIRQQLDFFKRSIPQKVGPFIQQQPTVTPTPRAVTTTGVSARQTAGIPDRSEVAANYRKREWQMSMEETNDSKSVHYRDELSNSPMAEASSGDSSSSALREMMDSPEEKRKAQEEDEEYRSDIAFVRKLLAQYDINMIKTRDTEQMSDKENHNDDVSESSATNENSDIIETPDQEVENMFELETAQHQFEEIEPERPAAVSFQISNGGVPSESNDSRAEEYHGRLEEEIKSTTHTDRFKKLAQLDKEREMSDLDEARNETESARDNFDCGMVRTNKEVSHSLTDYGPVRKTANQGRTIESRADIREEPVNRGRTMESRAGIREQPVNRGRSMESRADIRVQPVNRRRTTESRADMCEQPDQLSMSPFLPRPPPPPPKDSSTPLRLVVQDLQRETLPSNSGLVTAAYKQRIHAAAHKKKRQLLASSRQLT